MKKILTCLFSTLVLCTYFACGGDDIEDPNDPGNTPGTEEPSTPETPEEVKNENQNGTTAQAIYTEAGYQKVAEKALNNIETPHLTGDLGKCFVVHNVPGYGINYTMEYDTLSKACLWIAYQWHKGNTHNVKGASYDWVRSKWKNGETFNGYGGDSDPFQPDPVLPKHMQTTLAQHKNNGYDRGHMLGSADRLMSKEANGQTFYLSNMHPQLGGFNQKGIWYNLEKWFLEKNNDSFRDTLYVVKGATIDKDNLLETTPAGLVVPKYFYMALLCKKGSGPNSGYKAIAFWMEHKENTDTDYKKYAISVNTLEKKTGIDFFCNLPDKVEEVVESQLFTSDWGL